MTVRHLARYNINNMEKLLGRVKTLSKPFIPIEIKKGYYVIDIPVRKTIIGHVNGKKNILNFNFWAGTFGIVAYQFVGGAEDAGGNGDTMEIPFEFGNYKLQIRSIAYGYTSTSPSFSSINLQNTCGSISSQISVGTLSDRTRITYYGTLPTNTNCNINEVGIYGTDGYGYPVYISILQQAFSPGSTIAYYIDLLQPWVENFGLILYAGLAESCSSGILDTSGNSHTVCYSSGLPSGASGLVGSTSSYTWSPSLYSINANVGFGTSHNVQNNQSSVVDYIQGTAIPSETLEIYTLALQQQYYDVNTKSNFLAYILILPLSSPITLYAGQSNTVSLRLVAE